MADEVGENSSLLTALENRLVDISVGAKKRASSSGKNRTSTSHFSPREHVLLAGTDSGAADEPKTAEQRAAVEDAQTRRETEAAQHFADLGLGRGVAATMIKPWLERTSWLEKTSFQVRSLEFDKLLGTAKGGAVEAYEHEVWSERKLQLMLRQSVAAASVPVTIYVDADLSRTRTKSQHVVGRRVHNRTISFREEFDEIPSAPDEDKLVWGKARPILHVKFSHELPAGFQDENKRKGIPFEGGYPVTPGVTTPKKSLEKEGLTFEERLAKWVLERLYCDGEKAIQDEASSGNGDPPKVSQAQPPSTPEGGKKKDYCTYEEILKQLKVDTGSSPVTAFENWFKQVPHVQAQQTDKLKQIHQLCNDFVSFFHVTHYVSALELGALEYTVMTEEDYVRQVGAAGSLGLEKVVSATLKSKSCYSLHKTHKYSQMKRVGLIKNPEDGEYYVPRGTYAEAVIGVQMKPIHTLVRNEHLHKLLRDAVTSYIEEKEDRSVGPFLITLYGSNHETVYLSVNEEDMSLQATTIKKEASNFFIVMNDDGSNVHEFHIVYWTKAETAKKIKEHSVRTQRMSSSGQPQEGATQPLPHCLYLSARLSIIGINSHPLHFELNPKRHHTIFVLHSRLRTRYAPAEVLDPWLQGHEGYFINCQGRKFAYDGYLAVHRVGTSYHPVCVPTSQTTEGYFKVFTLVRPPMEEEQPDKPQTGKQLKVSI